jgi:Protein of unknown function, DUF481
MAVYNVGMPFAGRGRLRFAALAVGLALIPGSAYAAKTDVVTLTNGDRLTCEIKLLDKGRLQVSTDDLGTVNIEWDKVASVIAYRLFNVETSSGQRLLGQLTTDQPGTLNVVEATGIVSLAQATVVYIAPIGQKFWSRMDGSLNLGASYTQSSGIAQVNVSGTASYRQPDQLLTLSGSSYLTHEEGDDTSRHTVSLSSYRALVGQTFWLAQGGFDRSPELGYDLRSTLSGGIGQFLSRSNRGALLVGGGLSGNREQPVDGEGVTNLDALFVTRGSYFRYDSPKTNLAMNIAVYPGLSQWGRVRVEFDGTVSREIVSDFTIGFNIYDSYDNRPPSADARKNDVGLSLTVGWTF